jgi:hypothetical protein
MLLVGRVAAAAAAEARGAPPGEAHVTLADFNAGHRLVTRALTQGSLEKVFLRNEEHAFDVLTALPLWEGPPIG